MTQDVGQSTCNLCEQPRYTISIGERICRDCNAGFFAVFHDASVGHFSSCQPCPAGVDCAAGVDPSVMADYYAIRDPVTLSLQTFPCGGSRCASNALCSSNRAPAGGNPLCGQCLPGFSEWDGECVACPGVNIGLVFGLLLLAWVCVLVIHGFSQRSSNSSALRITLLFWQVAPFIVDTPSWTRWASFLGLNFLTASFGSAYPFPATPLEMTLVLQLGPLLPYAFLLATAMCHRGVVAAVAKRCTRACGLPSFAFNWSTYFRTTIALYFFTFNVDSITRQSLQFFSCTELPSGRYMTSMPAMRCDSTTYRALAPLAAAQLVCYAVVVPAYIAFKLNATRASRQLNRPELVHWWGVVYGPFRNEAMWWGMSQMLFRLLLVCVAVFLWAQDAARLGAFTLLCAASLILLLLVKPNKEAADDAWELVVLTALLVLATTKSMNAPEAVLAVLTLGVGGLITLRLLLGAVRSRCQRQPAAAEFEGCKDRGGMNMDQGTSDTELAIIAVTAGRDSGPIATGTGANGNLKPADHESAVHVSQLKHLATSASGEDAQEHI